MVKAKEDGKSKTAAKRNLIVLLAVLVVAIGIALAVVLTQGQSDDSGSSSTAQRSSPRQPTVSRTTQDERSRTPGRTDEEVGGGRGAATDAKREAERTRLGMRKSRRGGADVTIDPKAERLYRAASEYLRRYDKVVTSGQGWLQSQEIVGLFEACAQKG